MEEALTRIVDNMGVQNEQTSIRMIDLKRAVHIERESLWEEILRNRQEVSTNESRLRLKNRTEGCGRSRKERNI